MESLEDELNHKVTKMVRRIYSGELDFEETYDQIKQMLEVLAKDERCSAVTLTNFGAALSDTGHHRAAIPYLEKAIESGADFHQAYFNLGVALVNVCRADEGRKHMSKAHMLEKRHDAIEAYFDPMGH